MAVSEPGDEAFVRELRERLRETEASEAGTGVRLSAARARSLEVRAGRPVWAWWAAAGGLIAASVVVATMTLHPPFATDRSGWSEVAHDDFFFEQLVDEDEDPMLEAELYEDLDVLTWLAEADERV